MNTNYLELNAARVIERAKDLGHKDTGQSSARVELQRAADYLESKGENLSRYRERPC